MSKDFAPSDCSKQSAVIPYRSKNGALEVLLITSRRKKNWIIPKGIIEPHLSPQKSAAKEALEEAGLTGKVSKKSIGSYKFNKCGRICTAKVYCMKVKKVNKKWEEPWRKRKWFALDKIPKRIKKKALRNIVLKLPDFLQHKPVEWV